ncbi:beta-lactamase/transpeptidase-like protein [Phyllosticta citriasiana]|uniref:Beta-lactamase/transpeptidase-like protein n=1 Tax=Phyllosticta citriasiana TaxID=595635 RepID=A0ABR1KFW1_9PEZI
MDSFSHTVAGFLKPQATDSPLPFVTLGAVDEPVLRHRLQHAAGLQDTTAVHWVASCSKLVTTIAALQCVEKGLLTLDGDIGDVLAEWKNPKILVGFEEDGEPILKPAQNHISLSYSAASRCFQTITYTLSRHVLSRSSGMAYAFLDPLMSKYQEWHGAKPKNNLTIYSPEAEYVGLLVERVNGGIKLGEYMRRNIFEPLGIRDMTFHLEEREDMRKRQARMWQRTPDGGLQMLDNCVMPDPVIDDFGGTGLYATVPELLKIYAALLRDDERLLKKETIDLMFTPHIPTTVDFDDARKASVFVRNSVFNSIPDDTAVNSGLGGVMNTTPVPGRRGAPSLTRSGMSNCFWLLPGGDNKTIELLSNFEEAVYAAQKQKYAKIQ